MGVPNLAYPQAASVAVNNPGLDESPLHLPPHTPGKTAGSALSMPPSAGSGLRLPSATPRRSLHAKHLVLSFAAGNCRQQMASASGVSVPILVRRSMEVIDPKIRLVFQVNVSKLCSKVLM